MLEKVDLTLALKKQEYKDQAHRLTPQLTLLQRACWEALIPVIIVFEGWDASGKGTSINLLAQNMDPRGFRIHPIKGATPQEKQMPWLWRFWLRIPNYGEVAIFDRSWYGRVLVERVEKLTPPDLWQKAYHEILEFEQTLAEDGYVIIKFFLHISKKEQKKRFKHLQQDPHQSWRVLPEDLEHHRKYNEYLVATEEMLAMTESEWGPWTIVEATDRYWSWIKILSTVNRRLEESLIQKGKPIPQVIIEPNEEVQP